jgi:hypothetical protein
MWRPCESVVWGLETRCAGGLYASICSSLELGPNDFWFCCIEKYCLENKIAHALLLFSRFPRRLILLHLLIVYSSEAACHYLFRSHTARRAHLLSVCWGSRNRLGSLHIGWTRYPILEPPNRFRTLDYYSWWHRATQWTLEL